MACGGCGAVALEDGFASPVVLCWCLDRFTFVCLVFGVWWLCFRLF